MTNNTAQACLVCLDNSDSTIKSITNLIKICECDYWIHEICIHAWLIKEPTCPICKKLLIYNTEEDDKNPNIIVPVYAVTNKEKKLLYRSLLFIIVVLIIVTIVVIIMV